MVLKSFFDISTSFRFSKDQCECTLHSEASPCFSTVAWIQPDNFGCQQEFLLSKMKVVENMLRYLHNSLEKIFESMLLFAFFWVYFYIKMRLKYEQIILLFSSKAFYLSILMENSKTLFLYVIWCPFSFFWIAFIK